MIFKKYIKAKFPCNFDGKFVHPIRYSRQEDRINKPDHADLACVLCEGDDLNNASTLLRPHNGGVWGRYSKPLNLLVRGIIYDYRHRGTLRRAQPGDPDGRREELSLGHYAADGPGVVPREHPRDLGVVGNFEGLHLVTVRNPLGEEVVFYEAGKNIDSVKQQQEEKRVIMRYLFCVFMSIYNEQSNVPTSFIP